MIYTLFKPYLDYAKLRHPCLMCSSAPSRVSVAVTNFPKHKHQVMKIALMRCFVRDEGGNETPRDCVQGAQDACQVPGRLRAVVDDRKWVGNGAVGFGSATVRNGHSSVMSDGGFGAEVGDTCCLSQDIAIRHVLGSSAFKAREKSGTIFASQSTRSTVVVAGLR